MGGTYPSSTVSKNCFVLFVFKEDIKLGLEGIRMELYESDPNMLCEILKEPITLILNYYFNFNKLCNITLARILFKLNYVAHRMNNRTN